MKAVIQRVQWADVIIDGQSNGKIQHGLMVLLGVALTDTLEDVVWLSNKIVNMRIFSDSNDKMNLSLHDIDGELLVISQFTLHASTKKGNRPSFTQAAKPELAIPLYENFVQQCEELMQKKVQTGIFGADMKVSLLNDGPVTIIIDSQNKE